MIIMSLIVLAVLGLHIGAGWLYWCAVAVYGICHGVARAWELGLMADKEERRDKRAGNGENISSR